MLTRRAFAALSLGLPLVLAVPAIASVVNATKFTPAALADAQKSGKPVLVEVSAPWCPTCKAQKAVFSELEKQDRFKSFVKLEVDYDSQKADLRSLAATRQSTLIVFKGDKEVGRVVGETRREAIEELLAKAL